MVRVLLPSWLALLAVLLAVPSLRANALEKELEKAAQDIRDFVKNRGPGPVFVGDFVGLKESRSSGGAGIAQVLRVKLAKANLQVLDKGPGTYQIHGTYEPYLDEKTGMPALKIVLDIQNKEGKKLLRFQRGVFGESELAALLGLTTALPPKADREARDTVLIKSITKPHAPHLLGNSVAAVANHPYRIEIFVKQGDKYIARTPTLNNNLAFVPLKRDDVYAIHLINDSDFEAGVKLTIDGINLFAFRDGGADQGNPMIVLPARSKVLIEGWFINPKRYDEFLVTEYAKSVAAQLKSPDQVGSITACFSAAWEVGKQPPADEPPAAKAALFSRSDDGTGRGEKRESANFVEVRRQFGVVRATVTVRYLK